MYVLFTLVEWTGGRFGLFTEGMAAKNTESIRGAKMHDVKMQDIVAGQVLHVKYRAI